MSAKLQHTIIRASAGTGKTYQLANRYIALLLLQATGGGKIAPEKIVAMTFTKKGAAEFAERILHRLAAAAGDATERKELQADLVRVLQGDKGHGLAGLAPSVKVPVDEATLQSALAVMIDHFDRLVLGTIDGFMARSVQTLAFELGLGGFEILEESAIQREREELIGGVLRAVRAEHTESFYQTLKRATLKSSSSLRRELDGFVKAYHKLLNALPQAEAWGGSSFWNGAATGSLNPHWKQEAAALGKQIAGSNFGHANISKSLAGALDWLVARDPGSGAGKIASWLDQEGKLAEIWHCWPEAEWTFDYSGKPRAVPAPVMQLLRPILKGWLAAECAALSRKTAAIHEIVSHYEELYDRLARRKGRLAFDDLPLLLDEGKGTEAAGAALRLLAFRWYQQFDHWLLDEFQDTSRVQWSVLKPWLDEAIQDVDGGKSVFVVGDAKQSIYGWRGGEQRLFDDLAGSYPGAFAEQVMAESWRSRPAVLELVNRVCAPDANPALRDPEKFSSAALERWHYDWHVSETARQSQPGYAAVLLAAKAEPDEGEAADAGAEVDDGISDKLAAQARVIKTVIEKVRPLEKGLSCAVLVRKNEHAQAVAQWLRANGVPQVMVEGVATLAEQSPMVAALVDALRWLAVPANTLAAGHVSVTPLWDVLKQPVKNGEAEDVSAGTVWRHWRRRVADVGVAQMTREWCDALSLTHVEPYAVYSLRHVSQLAQLSGASLKLSEWLATLEQLTVRETSATGSVHVMTIHKAKGLGFDVVFLPDLDSGGGGQDDILIRRDGQGCAIGCVSNPPKWLQAWNRTLGDFSVAQKAERDLEALCVLYVALTRAKEATFVILNGEKPRKSSPAREWILSALLRSGDSASVQPVETLWGRGVLFWENGSQDFGEIGRNVGVEVASTQPLIALPAPLPRRKRSKPSDAGHDACGQGAAGAGSTGGKEFGTAVHAVFEQIEWWTSGQSLEGSEESVALVRICMDVPEILALFTPDAERDEALRELPVEFMERNIWWSGIIDRLVLRRDAAGALRKAVLLDFKTDRVDGGAILRERYSEQLQIYRRAISTALKLSDDKVEAVLVSTHLGALFQL